MFYSRCRKYISTDWIKFSSGFGFLLMLCAIGPLLQSHTEIDSLLKISVEQEGKEKISTFINIARAFYVKGDAKSLQYSEKAINLSHVLGFDLGLGQAMLFHGIGLADSQPDSALSYYVRSSEILISLDHPWAHYGYKNAADLYINKGRYPEALELTHKILHINRHFNDTLLMVESLSTLGHLHYSMKEFDEAHYWQLEALNALGNLEDPVRKGLIYGRIGIGFDERNMQDSAMHYNDLALKYFKDANAVDYIAQWLSNVANTLIKAGQFEKAGEKLEEALTYQIHPDRKAVLYNNLGKVYLETGRYAKAENILDSAAFYAKKFKHLRFLADSYFRKHELQLKQGNVEEAFSFYIHYSQLKDSLWDLTKTEQLAQMRAMYEIEEKEKTLLLEIAEKEKLEKEHIQAQLIAANRQKWIWGISLLAFFIVSLVLLFLIRLKRKAKQEKQLAIVKEQEKGFAAVINAQEEERKRVAKDLHDGIGQQISALSLKFQVLSGQLKNHNPQLIPALEKINRLIQNTSQDVREVSHQMMPRALTEFGLADALEDMLDICFSNTSIEYSFKHKNMKERLPAFIEIGLYRVCQELVNNIIKHAGAKKVSINLYKNESFCVLNVNDDGTGMEKKLNNGMGITSINTRVVAMKGTFRLVSEHGKGTTAFVKIEL